MVQTLSSALSSNTWVCIHILLFKLRTSLIIAHVQIFFNVRLNLGNVTRGHMYNHFNSEVTTVANWEASVRNESQ